MLREIILWAIVLANVTI